MGITCIVLLVCLLFNFRGERHHLEIENQISVSYSKPVVRETTILRHRFLKSRVLYYPNGSATFQHSLLLSGDIELNPGPRAWNYEDDDELLDIKRPRFEGGKELQRQTIDLSKCIFCQCVKKMVRERCKSSKLTSL